jgi:hypothetical protein
MPKGAAVMALFDHKLLCNQQSLSNRARLTDSSLSGDKSCLNRYASAAG